MIFCLPCCPSILTPNGKRTPQKTERSLFYMACMIRPELSAVFNEACPSLKIKLSWAAASHSQTRDYKRFKDNQTFSSCSLHGGKLWLPIPTCSPNPVEGPYTFQAFSEPQLEAGPKTQNHN